MVIAKKRLIIGGLVVLAVLVVLPIVMLALAGA